MKKKQTAVAYVLWFFLGLTGAHRFYLGLKAEGAMQLGLLVSGVLFVLIGGALLLMVLVLWLLLDAFLIPGMVREHNVDLISPVAQPASSGIPKSKR